HHGPLPGGCCDPGCCGAEVRLRAAAFPAAAATAARGLSPPCRIPLCRAVTTAVAASRTDAR
ncbi:unnamed protein product, partial [Symbiodinium sp. CCMP2456]